MSAKRRPLTTAYDLQDPLTTRFSAAVDRLKERGISEIWKHRFRTEPDGRPVLVSGTKFKLDEAELEAPEFWVPVGFDGEGYKRELCAPMHIVDHDAVEWSRRWRSAFEWSDGDGVLEDPNDFIAEELASLACMIEKRDGPASTLATSAAWFLKRAMVEGYAAGGGFPPRTLESLSDGEALDLEEPLASILELAFRAGRYSARAALHVRGVPEIARKRKLQSDQVGKGKRRRTFEKLKEWERRVVELLKSDRRMLRRDLMGKLEDEGLAEPRAGDFWRLTGSVRDMSFESFASKVSNLAKNYP